MPLSAFLLAAVVGGQASPTAEEALRRSLERHSAYCVDAIVEQMSPWGGGYVRLHLWRDPAGRRRTEILSPVAMQGQVGVDDGTVWTTYSPDSKRLRSHPSPLLEPDDLDFRMRLVSRNYRLEIDEKTTVAGRSAYRVVAKPRNSELESRRFYIDVATFAPLRVESVTDLGGVTVQMAVRRIEFPAKLDRSTFEPLDVEGARRDRGHPATPVRDLDEAERKAGFRPAQPRWLPMGFRAQGMDVMDWHGITPVQTRITDGLVRLFIYQFRIPDGNPPTPRPGDERKTFRDVGAIRIEVRGDAPAAARERILALYAKRLENPR